MKTAIEKGTEMDMNVCRVRGGAWRMVLLCAALLASPVGVVRAAIGTPTSIGTNTQSSTTTSLTITSSTTVAAGQTVIVTFSALGANVAGGMSCTDSKGHTYSVDVDSGASVGMRTVIFSMFVTTAFTTAPATTITITYPSAGKAAGEAFQVSGIPTARLDTTQKATGSSAAPSSGTTATTTQASELLIGSFGINDKSTSFTATNSFTKSTATPVSTGSASGNISHGAEYRLVSLTGSYAATAATTIAAFAAAIATYLSVGCGNGIVDGAEQCDQGAVNGTARSCCSATCAFVAASTTCRAATNECDNAETCTGASATCPTDTVKSSATACTDDGNVCTTDLCNGTLGAPACVHVAGNAGTVCRASAGDCDPGESCTGSSATCPADNKSPAATPCSSDGNGCTVDECDGVANACQHPIVADGTACSDGSVCTMGDVCSGGTCNPGAPLTCGDGNVCTIDTCNPATGCVFTNNTNPCEDGNACTTGDTCSAGACVSGAALGCDDGNPCTDDSCNPATGCANTNSTNACDDGNACTAGDTCASGACVSGPAPNCDDSNVCTTDTCVPAIGCSNVFTDTDNDAVCDANDNCPTVSNVDQLDTDSDTIGDACECLNVVCPPLSCHEPGVCDLTTGACAYLTQPDNAACDDGNPCTSSDVCTSGVCQGSGVCGALVSVPAVSHVGPDMDVAVPITINPADGVLGIDIALTYDSSVVTPTGVYVTGYAEGMTVVPSLGTPGEASFAMFGPPTLSGNGQVAWVVFHAIGAVGSSSPLTFTVHDLNEGAIASDPGDGVVNVVARDVAFSMPDNANGAPGSSVSIPISVNPVGSLSTFDTTLHFNPAIVAATSVARTSDTLGWSLSSDLSTPGTAIVSMSGSALTGGPRDIATITFNVVGGNGRQTPLDLVFGTTNSGMTVNLDDGLFTVCPDDDNDGYTACGGDCNDADPAVHPGAAESCDAVDQNCDGVLNDGGADASCDDGNPCSDDTCDATGVCLHMANTVWCSDGNACTTGDACSGGACQAGTPIVCNDNHPCTDDSCDPTTGCAHTSNTNPCDDGNACTTGDVCGGGTCHGGPAPDCNDNNPCTDDSCDLTTGCAHASNTNPCGDGNGCTTGDVCGGGTCHGGPAPDCNDDNPCTDDSCVLATGCRHSNNTAPCNDGNLCTRNDACVGGLCVGSNSVTCAAIDQCHLAGICNSSTGACSNPHVPDGTACSDGNDCSVADTCTTGICSGTTLQAPAVINYSVRVNTTPTNATIVWTDPPGAFNVYRGWRVPAGAWSYNQTCLSNGLVANSSQDTDIPPPNRLFYYLVTRVDSCDESPLGTDSAGTQRPNNNPCVLLVDADGDGITDALDNCPLVSNANQADADYDGRGDRCDNCPTVSNPGQDDIDLDGLGDFCDPDIDGDGVPNDFDNCVNIYNPDQADSDNNGVGNACEPSRFLHAYANTTMTEKSSSQITSRKCQYIAAYVTPAWSPLP